MLPQTIDYSDIWQWGFIASGDELYQTGDATKIQYAKVEGETLIVSEIRPGCGSFFTHPENCECQNCTLLPREWKEEICPFTGEVTRYQIGPSVGDYSPIPHAANCNCRWCEYDRQIDEGRSHQYQSEDDL